MLVWLLIMGGGGRSYDQAPLSNNDLQLAFDASTVLRALALVTRPEHLFQQLVLIVPEFKEPDPVAHTD